MSHQARHLVGLFFMLAFAVVGLRAAPITGVTLAASPPGQCLAGRTITLTATPIAGDAVEYRFFKVYNGVTTTIQPYTLGANTFQITPTELGQYQFTVWAREQGSATKVFAAVTYKVNPPLSDVTISATPAWPQAPGTPVTLRATQVNGGQIEYRFYIAEPGGALTIVQQYGAASTYTFTPSQQGEYQFMVYAREVGSAVAKQAYKSMTYSCATPITGVTLTTNPPTSGLVGAPVTLTAQATGGFKVQYRFFVLPPGGAYTTIQHYAVDAKSLQYTPTLPGKYSFMVYVRETHSTKPGKDAYKVIPYTAVADQVAVSISPANPHVSVTKTLQLAANVTGTSNTAVTWRMVEPNSGTISPSGLYTAPASPGVYLVEAASVADPTAKATVMVTVEAADVEVIVQ